MIDPEARAIAERQERLSYIGRLASGVAHDMNNLITMVSLRCDLLETTAELPGSARTAVERIQQVCQSAAGMTARLQRLRVTSTGPGRCAVTPVVRGAVPLLESIAGDGIEIGQHLEVGDEVEVALADSELMQVLLNLVSNAADALGGTGRIDIRVSPTLMASGQGGVELTVSDSGPGVPELLRPVLFDLFASTKGEGRGLGLPTVRTLIESCGGRIHLVELEASGAVFRIELPLATAD